MGYQQRGTVTGHVFNDANGNGVQDPGELNLSGVTVNVTDSLGVVHPAVTNSTGDYSVGVPAGTTTADVVEATLPAGSVLTAGTDPQTVVVAGGTTQATSPVGYQQRGTVTGHVFNDVNGNGVQDPGEPNLPNVSLTVTDSLSQTQTVYTDASGNYTATVPVGSTTVKVLDSLPSGSVLTTANDQQTVAVAGGANSPTTPIGYQQLGAVAGRVFNDINGNGTQDPGEPGLTTVTLTIVDSVGTTHTVVTDGSGDYSLSVPVGSTIITVDETTVPPGSVLTAGLTPQTVTVGGGSTTTATPIGYQQQGTVSGHVFNDANGNGVQDLGEPDMASISVNILDSLGHTQTVITNGSGNYSATVPAGAVTADVLDSTVPPGSVLTTANDPQSVSVPAGGTGNATPVGFQYLSQQTGTVSGHIYDDVNGNGVQDPGEPGLPGVSVVVTDNQGTTHTVVTDSNGDYQTTTPVGSVTAKVDESTLPPGSVRTGGSDPQTVTVSRNTDAPTQPVGYQQRGTVTGHVFNDMNGNGVQDPGEPDLPGVTVNVTDSLGTVHPLTTDGSGNWSVVVPVGSTTAKVDESSLPAGSVRTAGGDPQTVTAVGGATTPTDPVGYQQRGKVAGHLFEDVNGNGVQDIGEPDLSNVKVDVTDSFGSTHPVTTNGSGDYEVTVPVGSVTASVDRADTNLPAGERAYDRKRPSDGYGGRRNHDRHDPGGFPVTGVGNRPCLQRCERQRSAGPGRAESGQRYGRCDRQSGHHAVCRD